MADDPSYLVRVEDLTVRLGGANVVEHVSLDVGPGEIVTLIGPNGAGKTTLVRAILGLVDMHGGRIRRRPGLAFGYVPQRFHVDATLPMTVARFLALPRSQPRAAVEQALAETGVGHTADRPLMALSGGEFQRVMLARALLREPGLLVLDEPLQGVDLSGQIALFELIGRLRRAYGFSVLMVSHDLHLVMRATDRVICLNHHVCCHGEPEAVSRNPEYLHLFGRAGAETLAIYTHEHDHAHDITGDVIDIDDDRPSTGPAHTGHAADNRHGRHDAERKP